MDKEYNEELDCPYCWGKGYVYYVGSHGGWPHTRECKFCEGNKKVDWITYLTIPNRTEVWVDTEMGPQHMYYSGVIREYEDQCKK